MTVQSERLSVAIDRTGPGTSTRPTTSPLTRSTFSTVLVSPVLGVETQPKPSPNVPFSISDSRPSVMRTAPVTGSRPTTWVAVACQIVPVWSHSEP